MYAWFSNYLKWFLHNIRNTYQFKCNESCVNLNLRVPRSILGLGEVALEPALEPARD